MSAITRKGDFWSGLALAALGTYIFSQAWGWTYTGEEGPGAGFFPLWYGGIMVVLSLLLVAGAVLKRDPNAENKPFAWGELRRALACWLAFAVCVAIMKYVGFIIAFSLLTWYIVAILFRQPQRIALSLALGSALAFYALFSWGLDLTLPAGLLFNR